MANLIKYTGTEGDSYSEMKTKAQAALTKVGKSFTWSQVLSAGTQAKAAHITELINAFNTAYAAVVLSTTGNSGYGSCNTTTTSNGYSTCSSTTSGYSGNNSSDKYQCVSYLNTTGNTKCSNYI